MVDRLLVEGWQYRAVDEIACAPWVDIAVVVVCWQPKDTKPRWFANLRNLKLHATTEIYDLYEQVGLQVCAGQKALPGAEPRNLTQLLEGVPLMHVVPNRTKGIYDRFSDADVEALRALNLDVLVRFGFRILKGEVLSTARHGIWSYHHGDPADYRGGPSCFWEMSRGESTVGVVLQRLTEKLDAGEVLYRSVSSVPKTFWVHHARMPHYLKSATFIRRALERLYETGEPPRPATDQEEERAPGQLYRKPGNLRAAALLTRMAARSATATIANVTRQPEWSVVVRRAHSPLKATSGAGDVIGEFGGRDWQAADPYLFEHGGRLYCFFERIARGGDGAGQIWCVEILNSGRLTEPQQVLACDYHLSYPSLVKWRNAVFLCAETGDVGGIRTWQAEQFPLIWQYHTSNLEDVRAYDPTLLEWNGLWYLFVTIDESGGGSNDELFLYFGDTPWGPWTAHPENPVVSDCRMARPAGALFMEDGKLIRPAQDCSGIYGRAINLCQVDELSPTGFRQHVIARMDAAAWRGVGCHTLSQHRGIQAIDIRRTALRWPRFGRASRLRTRVPETRA